MCMSVPGGAEMLAAPESLWPRPPPQDCCSELEARGAGAIHAASREDKEEQVARDVPRTSYLVGSERFGCEMGDRAVDNVHRKKVNSA